MGLNIPTIQLIAIIVTFITAVISLIISIRSSRRTQFINTVTSSRINWIGELRELVSEYISLVYIYDKKPILKGSELMGYLDKILKLDARITLQLNYKDDEDKKIIKKVNMLTKIIMDSYNLDSIWEQRKFEQEQLFNDFRKVLEDNKINMEFMLQEEIDKIIDHPDYAKAKEVIIKKGLDPTRLIELDLRERDIVKRAKEQQHIINQLVEDVQTYLKYEWERVKLEAEKGRLSKFEKDILKNEWILKNNNGLNKKENGSKDIGLFWRITGLVYAIWGITYLFGFCKLPDCIKDPGSGFTLIGIGLAMLFWGLTPRQNI